LAPDLQPRERCAERERVVKALQITEYGAPLTYREVPRPVPTGSQVLVRVTNCGMCHSDVHLHSGSFNIGGGQSQSIARNHTLPFTMGHEIEGVVAETGPEAELPAGVAPGTRCAVYPWIGCGKCAACLRGEEQLCDAPVALGVQAAGGYADFVLVPHGRYLLPAEGLAPGHAGLLMCSGLTAYGAVLRMHLHGPDDPWLLIGAGGLGLTALSLARGMGLAPPHVADSGEAARATALQQGAAASFEPTADALKEARASVGGGFSGAIDFVGTETTAALAISAVRRGGAVIVVGLYGGLLTIPLMQFPLRQLRLEGSFTGTLPQARDLLDLVRRAGIAPIPVQHRKLAEGDAALDDLRERRVVGRVVLEVG
jgi:D-arabinose 1-dehydrogenase-like Zn-dependent alcohol dehydrogenase